MERAEVEVMERDERLTAEMAFSNPTSIVIKIRRRLPDFLQSVKLKYIRLGYRYYSSIPSPPTLLLLLASSAFALLLALLLHHHHHHLLVPHLVTDLSAFGPTLLRPVLALLAAVLSAYYLRRPRPVYLIDFACFKPDPKNKITREAFLAMTTRVGVFTDENTEFQSRITWRSGLGDETYLPDGILSDPPSLSMSSARKEAEQVMFGSVDALLAKTGVNVSDIGVLVVNCSLFNPTPSLSSMLVNRYNLRPDIKSYNLGGMGCSAGLIAVDLAKDLLHSNSSSLALVVSTENITLNWYFGNDRSMLLANCIFRMGAAAVLLSTRAADRRRSKYQLVHTLRTHKGADPNCHGCVYQKEDEEGRVGVSLSRELMAVAGDALTANITTLGPLVLPLSEQLKFFASFVYRKIVRAVGAPRRWKAPRAYVPDFKKAFEHVCVHAGGRAVLDEVERNLRLSEEHMEPSRSALHRFGNTSSSSLWYELGYVEAKGRVRGGDRVWQIAFGSGFKCNSAVWRALRDVDPKLDPGSPWADCIDRYPVKC